MTEVALLVVPTERHVERAGREGIVALTWARLRARLASAFLPRVVWAAPETTPDSVCAADDEYSSVAPLAIEIAPA